jgi:hypothetical protein
VRSLNVARASRSLAARTPSAAASVSDGHCDEATNVGVGGELKGASGGVERYRMRGLKPWCGRRETPGKVLKE